MNMLICAILCMIITDTIASNQTNIVHIDKTIELRHSFDMPFITKILIFIKIIEIIYK